MIAKPCRKVGLTAEKAAHLMMDGGWETFGIPSVITSDQGAQFVGQWWRTLCARLGVRQAFSQAYRPQANGRAEVAGRTLINILRKLDAAAGGGLNWVEALPRVLRMYHDAEGESGLSPFQIMFGRTRNLAGVPYEIPRACEGVEDFLRRQAEVDTHVAKVLNESHVKEALRLNAKRAAPYAVQGWRLGLDFATPRGQGEQIGHMVGGSLRSHGTFGGNELPSDRQAGGDSGRACGPHETLCP